MYLRSVRLQNTKLIRDLTLDFTKPDGQPRLWTVLIGENGTCKTTILKTIALAVAGGGNSAVLADAEELWPLRPGGRAAPAVDLQVCLDERDQEGAGQGRPVDGIVRRSLHARPGQASLRSIDEADDVGLAGFCVAYGTRRDLPAPFTAVQPQSSLDRLRPLFEPKRLVATGFADLLPDRQRHDLVRTLRRILAGDSVLAPRIADIELRGRGGVRQASDLIESHRFQFGDGPEAPKVPAIWLSEGYQSTIAWVADLVGHYYLYAGQPVAPAEMTGLVLLDELDAHLHPRWQSGLVRALKATFPWMQFVATTHSPMVLPGLDEGEIVRLRLDGHEVRPETVEFRPQTMTGGELLEQAFDATNPVLAAVHEKLMQYVMLAANPARSTEDERAVQEVLELLRSLELAPPWPPVRRAGGAS
ncbi:MAG: AAA family ATPase [Fimbriimonadaceae bacterium]|nr:AAA family ATPase [Fimbriimonadaceae bacterium]